MEAGQEVPERDDYASFNRYTVSGYIGTKVLAEGIKRCGICGRDARLRIEQLNKLNNFSTGG